ncbi:MAG: ATP-dependent helicase HrpB [Bdellovibrionaceae bacterium]|nr:ATP-dependent helicase HrpB [Pseudobdellovibrionaceae bacterium]
MADRIPLPIDEFLPEILRTLRDHDSLVLTAAPGAGKTTRLPPACLDLVKGQVLVLEPRRMAAVAAASRIAEENGWQTGQEVGWQVRFDNRTSASTRLVFLTEALLARRMIGDPELKGVDLVVLDEFHERSLHTDLTLGLLKELRELGRPLKIVVMSATLTAERIAGYLGGCPIIAVPGKLFELRIQHQKTAQKIRTDHGFFDHVAEAVKNAQAGTARDLLVFLPGVGEIERVRERLADWARGKNVDLVPLHGSLPLEEQRRALQKGARARVVLSTNIAESSVTVDGVDTVIDSGLAKSNRFDVRTGFSRLELGRISLSSAVQRSGRAARQYPGRGIRLWSPHDELALPKDDVPEIQRADLTEALLFLAQQGVSDFRRFSWFEAPAAPLLQAAEKTLRALGALSADNKLTPRGGKMLRYPLPPRIAGLMLAAEEMEAAGRAGAVDLAARIAAILQERDFVRDDTARAHRGDQLECDLLLRVQLLDSLKPRTILAAADQIRRLARGGGGKAPSPAQIPLLLRELLIRAFADRLCRRRRQSDRALMMGGRGVKLAPESLVRDSEFLIAVQGVEGLTDAETVIRIACGFDKDFVLKHFADRIEKRQDLFVDEGKGTIFLREARYLDDLPLEEANLSPAPPDRIAAKLPELLVARFPDVLKRHEDLASWMARWNYLKRRSAELGRPVDFDFSPAALKSVFEEAAYGEKSFEAVLGKDLIYFFESALPPEEARRLREETPDKIEVPTGNRLKLHYPEDKEPYLEVRLQEVFGWLETPKILDGQVSITLHLLGPNYRPVQVTANLRSFWQNGYPEVRKELRARYPKHSWPDDPLTARPEAKGRPRR